MSRKVKVKTRMQVPKLKRLRYHQIGNSLYPIRNLKRLIPINKLKRIISLWQLTVSLLNLVKCNVWQESLLLMKMVSKFMTPT